MSVKQISEKKKLGYCHIIASIMYYENQIGNIITAKKINEMINDAFWQKEGFHNSNMNRPKMVWDLCKLYHIPNNGYDDIHKYWGELYRPNEEINAVYNELYSNQNASKNIRH